MGKPVLFLAVARSMTREKFTEIAEQSARAARPYQIERRFELEIKEKEQQDRKDFYARTEIRRGGSWLRPLLARRERVFKLTQFAKNFLQLYLNSELDVDGCVDQLTGYRQRREYERRHKAIRFAKTFLFAYLNSGKDADEIVMEIVAAE